MKHAHKPMHRRQFLKKATLTAGALAIPSIVPATVLGANAPSNRVNLAMIGVGGRGSGVMNGFAQHDDVRFLAIADAYTDRRERAKAQLNQRYGAQVTEAYDDFRDVLKRDDIDGVVRLFENGFGKKPLLLVIRYLGTLR